jgi:drug/metabolite transporter (DMT)-like permease
VLAPRVTAALVAVQIFFGVNYFISKLVLSQMAPRAWACVRVGCAAVLLLVWTHAVARRPWPSRQACRQLAWFAFFGAVFNQILFVEGLSRTTPAHSAIINSLIPVLTLGFAILLRREPATAERIAAIALAFASVLVLLRVESFRLHDDLVKGDLLTLANASSFSLFLVMSRDALRRADPLVATTWMLTFGAVGILLVGGSQLARAPLAALPPSFWLLAAYVIVCATVLTYFLNYYALGHTDSSMVALFIYLQPPIATALSAALLGERPDARFYVAAAGIFAGVYLAVRAERRLRLQPTMSGPNGRRPANPAS